MAAPRSLAPTFVGLHPGAAAFVNNSVNNAHDGHTHVARGCTVVHPYIRCGIISAAIPSTSRIVGTLGPSVHLRINGASRKERRIRDVVFNPMRSAAEHGVASSITIRASKRRCCAYVSRLNVASGKDALLALFWRCRAGIDVPDAIYRVPTGAATNYAFSILDEY